MPPGSIWPKKLSASADVYFKPKQRQSAMDHQAMNAALDPAVSRFTVRQRDDEDEASYGAARRRPSGTSTAS